VPREFIVNQTCDEIVPTIQRELNAAGFRVEQSFDLRSALTLVPNCTCPHHGTALCDCRYNVLLIYGQEQLPTSLIVHGHDHQCWIALADDPNGRVASRLAADIVRALASAHLITIDEADDAAPQAVAS
jgi:hypothetical protein